MYLQLGQLLFGDFKASFDIPDEEFLWAVQNNLFAFSGAKSLSMYQQLRDLVTKDGAVRSWKEYREAALKLFEEYNLTWLATERQNIIRSGLMASEWQRIEEGADVYPYLRYKTEEDENVRPEHAAMNNIVRPVNDAFWNNYYPPNGWNCRCITEQLTEEEAAGKVTRDEGLAVATTNAKVPQTHKGNVGKSAVVYDGQHEYFKAMPQNRQLRAADYGMPAGEDIAGKGIIEPQSREVFERWFNERLNGADSFSIKSPKELGITPTVNKDLLRKLVANNRQAYGSELAKVLSMPNEVWSGYLPGRQFAGRWMTAFIRYYDGQLPIVALVDASGQVLSLQQVTSWAQLEQYRVNVLLYRN